VEAGQGGRRGVVAVEGHPPAEHLVEDHAQAVKVAPPVDGTALDLLRCEVLRRTDVRPLLREVGGLGGLGDAEVADLHPAVVRQHDVGRLDVPVDQPGRVGDVQGAGDLRGDIRGDPGPDGAVVQPLAQRLAADQLHDDGLDAVVAAGVVDADDRRVRQPCYRDGLLPEARDERLVGGEVRMEDLDRDGSPEDLVGAAPDRRHPARRELGVEPVASGQHQARGHAGRR
jgi:hypothetical protein